MSAASSTELMAVLKHAPSETAYPTGDPNFAVQQAFPAVISAEEADPFLMLDHFGPTPSRGLASNPDEFPVQWHPHRGMDICTYLLSGVGRHADSLGNRGSFSTPGIQWISVGSGIEHAEGGGSDKGVLEEGFQIWINVPKKKKMEDPRYGVGEPNDFPYIRSTNVEQRIVAGRIGDLVGPFVTAIPIQIIDFSLTRESSDTSDTPISVQHALPKELNNCIVYVHRGEGVINGVKVKKGSVVHLEARNEPRTLSLSTSSSSPFKALVAAGSRIGESISWRGPFVMNTAAEIQSTLVELRSGNFPPVRAPWNYKKLSSFPKDKLPKA